MRESTKTLCFVAAAALLGLAAIGNAWLNRPVEVTGEDRIGEPFYPDFQSTETARSLEVSAVDPESGNLKRFSVESEGDLWRIPTQYDYPAEAAARIAETSAAVMGLEREALVGMGESEFERFGVVDPLADDLEDPETAGKRITLKDSNGETLVDYIIGNELEETVPTRNEDQFQQETKAREFYIRMADDTQTYRVSLDIDLSTRFSDWIDPDLLRINRPDVNEISINNYKIEERGSGPFGMSQLFKKEGDQLSLRRESAADKWKLDGLNPEVEQVKIGQVDSILGVLDEMTIVGVRPKFKYEGKQLLKADLTLANIEELEKDREKASNAIRALQSDLMDKGFNFGGTAGNLELVSENGELEFGTANGMRYRLHVGAAVSDADETIEIGASEKEEEEEASEEAETETQSDESDDANRFMYVRVSFDETLLGNRPNEPVEPTEPEMPEGYIPAEPNSTEGESEAESGEDAEKEATPERDPAFVQYEENLAVYKSAKSEYEMSLTRYKQENEAFDDRIKRGKERVEQLNQRFGDWYYVISASNLKTIQSSRADVVEPVEQPEGGTPATPPVPNFSLPEGLGDLSTFANPQESESQMEDQENTTETSGDGEATEGDGKVKKASDDTGNLQEKTDDSKTADGADGSDSKKNKPGIESGDASGKSGSDDTDPASDAPKNSESTEADANAAPGKKSESPPEEKESNKTESSDG